MSDDCVVDLLGIMCNNDVPDSDGVIWNVEDIGGWASPDVEVSTMRPSGAHGLVFPASWNRQRIVKVPGSAWAPTMDAAWAAHERLTSLVPLHPDTGRFVVYEPVPKFLDVSLGDTPLISVPQPSREVVFTLILTSEYIYRRALTATTTALAAGTSPTVTLGGTKPAEFEVETTTAGTVSLTVGGMTLSTYSLPAGSVISSMPGRKDITGPSGEDLTSAFVPGSQWPAFVPGANSAANGGTAGLSLTVYDTFA